MKQIIVGYPYVLLAINAYAYYATQIPKGSGKQKLIDFIKLFGDELRHIGNKYLNRYSKTKLFYQFNLYSN
jgi:hypothetical protein